MCGLLEKVGPVPAAWIQTKDPETPSVKCKPCTSWRDLVMAWKRAMKLTEGLEAGLSFALAIVVSTEAAGDQLWGRLIGPPSCGKSVLCEALSVAKKFILAKSTIRGFHSGYKSDKTGEEDHSLIVLAKNKTLVVKDGDTILKLPNLGQVLAEARDVYDGTSRAHYRHGVKRDYEDHRMTFLLCGTESLRSLDSSELGERFLDCLVAEDMDEDTERLIQHRVALRRMREMGISAASGRAQDTPEMLLAKQLTGGYVEYLRENAQRLLSAVRASEAVLVRIERLAEFVSFVRARPSKTQEEKAQRELSFRLTSQLMGMAVALTVVLNRREVDEDVLRRVTKIARDTARGRTFVLVSNLYRIGPVGAETRQLAIWTAETEDSERKLLRFLAKIGVTELYAPETIHGLKGRPRWRLTDRLRRLYGEVTGEADPASSEAALEYEEDETEDEG